MLTTTSCQALILAFLVPNVTKEQSLDIILCSLLVVVFIVERVLFSFTIEVEGKKNGNSYGMSRHAIFVFTACILGAD